MCDDVQPAGTDDVVVDVLRDILGKLTELVGAVDRLGIRVMAVTAAAARIETHADEVAVDLAWAHQAADEVPEGSPAGARADAAVSPTPSERWQN